MISLFRDFKSLKVVKIAAGSSDFIGTKPLNIFQNKKLEELQMVCNSYTPSIDELCELKELKKISFNSRLGMQNYRQKIDSCLKNCSFDCYYPTFPAVNDHSVESYIPNDEEVIINKKMLEQYPENLQYQVKLISSINDYAWKLIRYGCPEIAVSEIEIGLKYNSKNSELIKNHIHALFFSGHEDIAKKEYLRFKNQRYSTNNKNKLYKAVFIEDLENIIDSDFAYIFGMEKIRKMINLIKD